jgi:hypothetical protein
MLVMDLTSALTYALADCMNWAQMVPCRERPLSRLVVRSNSVVVTVSMGGEELNMLRGLVGLKGSAIILPRRIGARLARAMSNLANTLSDEGQLEEAAKMKK